jgi:hypothetical protein
MAAWQANPGLLPFLLIAAAQAAQLAYEAWTARALTRWRISKSVWYAGGAFLMANWMLRLLEGAP